MNIGPLGRRRRMRMGWIALAVGVLAGGALMVLHVPRWWRALTFLPYMVGATGIFQARAKT